MRVLLSIKPEFANQIFDGTKRFEYRRRIFKRSVGCVVVYASAPVGKVIGEFEIGDVLHDDPDSLWKRTASHSGISKHAFDSYFASADMGYAIVITNARRYETPIQLDEAYGVKPPQSFIYV